MLIWSHNLGGSDCATQRENLGLLEFLEVTVEDSEQMEPAGAAAGISRSDLEGWAPDQPPAEDPAAVTAWRRQLHPQAASEFNAPRVCQAWNMEEGSLCANIMLDSTICIRLLPIYFIWLVVWNIFYFFPRASERRVLLIVGVCQTFSHLHIFSSSHPHIFTSSLPHILTPSHLLIFTSSLPHILTSSHLLFLTSSHLHIFSSSHLLIFTSAHLLILTSSHLHILTSSHLLIFTSAHLHIFTSSHLHISSSHPHIFTSSHLHIFTSSHFLIFTSSHLHIFSSSHTHIFTSSHPHILTSSHLLILTSSHLHILTSSNLLIFTSSHSLLPSCSLALLLSCPLALLPSCSLLLFYFSLEGAGQCQRDGTKCNLFARNEVRSPKTEVKLRFASCPAQPFRTKWGLIAKNWGQIAICKLSGELFRTKWGSIAKTCGKIAIASCPAQPFARNEVWSPKIEVKLRFHGSGLCA